MRLSIPQYPRCSVGRLCLVILTSLVVTDTLWAVKTGELELRVVDAATEQPIPARVRILNSAGRSPSIRQGSRQRLDVTFAGPLAVKRLKPGRYTFVLDRGPHYKQRTGYFDVDRDGFDLKTLELPRFVDPRSEGWFSGDLLVDRVAKDIELLNDAEELDLANVVVWKPGEPLTAYQSKMPLNAVVFKESIADFSGGTLNADGGTLIVGNLSSPVDPMALPQDLFDLAKSMKQDANAHVAIGESYALDLPMLVAHGLLDSIVVLNADQLLDGDVKSVDAGYPSDKPGYRLQGGMGRYASDIYFHLLNCGLRIPPSATSGSGICDNPPGYNRVYVACGQDFSAETWWRNLSKGRAIISNGPVLRVRANEELPGHVFEANSGGTVTLDIAAQLATRQKVEYLEIIKDGRVTESVRLDDWAAKGGQLPLIKFERSGWLSVRVVANSEIGYRCAMSAPFYVQIGETKQVSKASAEFFLAWVYHRAKQIRALEIPKEELLKKLEPHRVARDFWQSLVDQANSP